MAKSRLLLAPLLVATLLLVAACAAGPNDAAQSGGAGFWLGLWQGLISPITFLISLFNNDVNIYEVNNNGNWYNFGFMLGVSIAFSGTAGSGAAARPGRPRRSGNRAQGK
jgi:hypothetical protein